MVGFYRLYNQQMTFDQGIEFCKAKGGILAEITNEAENNAAWEVIKPYWNLANVDKKVWIGIHDRRKEGVTYKCNFPFTQRT